VSVTALVATAFPAIQDVSRAARSAEKLFDRLDRELPSTLEAIRLAGIELSDLSEEVNQGVQSASMVVKQVDLSITDVKKQATNIQTNTRSVWVGIKAAWQTFRTDPKRLPPQTLRDRSIDLHQLSSNNPDPQQKNFYPSQDLD
jgi:FtsZ-binding cell division protein ZapB